MSYINKYTLLGMLSKSYILSEDNTFIYKTKAHDKLICFDKSYTNNEAREINYAYIDEKLNIKGTYSSTEVISSFSRDYFTNLKKYSSEMYETKRKWDKYIEVKDELTDINEVLDLLDRWVKYSGHKYRFNRHDGYDRNFFKKLYEKHKKELTCRFFYVDNKLVGYSIMSPKINNTYYYIIRKVDITAGRNICEYVDYKTFEMLNDKDYLVNWGCSSGGVLRYKKSKFPLHSLKKYYFWKVKNEV